MGRTVSGIRVAATCRLMTKPRAGKCRMSMQTARLRVFRPKSTEIADGRSFCGRQPREQRAEIAGQLVVSVPSFAPSWNGHANFVADPVPRLDAIEKGLAARPDPNTRGLLTVKKAFTMSSLSDTEGAMRLLQQLSTGRASRSARRRWPNSRSPGFRPQAQSDRRVCAEGAANDTLRPPTAPGDRATRNGEEQQPKDRHVGHERQLIHGHAQNSPQSCRC